MALSFPGFLLEGCGMYIPAHFAETDLPTLYEFMRQHSFAALVTQHDGVPFASHLPLMLDSRIGTYGAYETPVLPLNYSGWL